ncbi:MAG: homoserine kinase [Deltaproteobacteria bacterium]|nr:homoserine kinase [Deltaproteobacteria bacterium]
MALYTRLTRQQILNLLKPFGFDAPQKIRGVLEGTVNTFYELTYPKKSYFLRVDEVADLKRLKNELRVFDLLERVQKRLSFKTTLPLQTKKGKYYVPLGKKYVLLFEKIHGASYFHHRLMGAHLYRIGRALAELHQSTKNCRLPPHRFNFPGLESVYREILLRLKKRHPTVALDIGQWMSWLKKNEPKGVPSGLIHADLFPENLLFVRDRLEGILDYEAAGFGSCLFDIAVTLHACCHDGKNFSIEKCLRFLRGYQSVRKLTAKEIKSFEYYLYQSAIRFLLTRLRDFELKPGPVKAKPFKDYREYLRRFAEIPPLVKVLKI